MGEHHGIGVMSLMQDAPLVSGDLELEGVCATIVRERRTLCQELEEQLAWFAEHPDIAMRRAERGS